ncbi:MAG: hypothetical protein CXT68_06780 [Methanobacteriota archaeon]|nr:MAG: hypothetical protein CXT68_06780 [Euryarchaeota archaeon]
MLNVTILSCLLILSGCIGGDDDDAEEKTEDENGCSTYEYQPVLWNATDHSEPIENDEGILHLSFKCGDELGWGSVQIEIIIDSVPTTCDNPGMTGGKCVVSQHGGSDDASWENEYDGETVTLTSTDGDFCDADCTITLRVKVDGDVRKSMNVDLM